MISDSPSFVPKNQIDTQSPYQKRRHNIGSELTNHSHIEQRIVADTERTFFEPLGSITEKGLKIP